MQEARQLAEQWRKEAEVQMEAAASARALETQRLIKQLQDRDIAARATLLKKDTALAQVCGLHISDRRISHLFCAVPQ